MDDNPYVTPAGARSSAGFYTDDITLLPTTAIWRILRRQPLLSCMLLFPYFLGRKALKLRHPANHGVCRPTELRPVSDEEVPADVRQALVPFNEVCAAHRMNHVCSFRPEWIGNKTGLYSLWLCPTGTTYCNISWIDLRLGSLHKSKVLFACHSRLASGVELHTAPVTPEDWIPELIPPDHDFLRLAADAHPADVIDRHAERISNRSDVVRFNAHSLLAEVIRRSQELFDYLVAKGIYAPLSVNETERLVAENNEMHRSGGVRAV